MLAPALEVRDLTRSFGARKAVSGLSLQVEAGDVYGFLGPNGAGKTTAMRCILGLIRRDQGTVKLFGSEGPAARAKVGAIIEVPAFHTWLSGRRNLALAAKLTGVPGAKLEAEIDRVLERVGLRERGSDRAGTYSLGMKQRLGIARALLGSPQLLLLDEPTNGLDPVGMKELRELIGSLAELDGITIFVSSHLLGEVQAMCNRVGIIDEGVMRAEGLVSEMMKGSGKPIFDVAGVPREVLQEHATVVGDGDVGRVRVQLNDGMTAGAFTRALVEAGAEMEALVPCQRTLEDVFLEVTR